MASLPGTAPAKALGQSRDITPVTRRDIFDLLREEGPWWGRLDETEFLGQLYDLDALPSTDSRHATAGEDIVRHRVANFDWEDDWVFSDQRFQLTDGPDQVLLDFLALLAHPLVQPDTEQAARLVAALNVLLAPDGWELRTGSFMSGRPVYSASRAVSGPGRLIRLEIGDDYLKYHTHHYTLQQPWCEPVEDVAQPVGQWRQTGHGLPRPLAVLVGQFVAVVTVRASNGRNCGLTLPQCSLTRGARGYPVIPSIRSGASDTTGHRPPTDLPWS
jgi:hypothetical protein